MRILFCGTFFPYGPRFLERMLPHDEVANCPQPRAKELGLEADVLIPLMHGLEPELIDNTRARMIHQWGVGLEGVDIPRATSRGIYVCNVPGDESPNADSTAEHAVFLMMASARRIHECFAAFSGDTWGAPMGEALSGNRALIVGFGRVGRALARKLTGLGMAVDAVRRTSGGEATDLPDGRLGGPSDLPELTATADFVISTVVLTDESREMFDRRFFDTMKSTAYFVNVSRGATVNEADLLSAVREGHIAGAGLDVFRDEPLERDHPFLRTPGIVCTPHIAGVTRQSVEGIAAVVAANIRRLKAGETPVHCVNLQALENSGAI